MPRSNPLARDPEALLRALHLLGGGATARPVGLTEAAHRSGIEEHDADDFARLLERERLIERTGPPDGYRLTDRGLGFMA